MTGTASQAVNFAAAGNYTISFSAAQRQNHQASSQEIKVTVDGVSVLTLTPLGTSYAGYTTASFAATAGSHTIAFVGLDPDSGDNTAFIDQASIAAVSSPSFSDPGFESPSEGTGSSAYKYNPSGAPWTYTGGAGVAGNGSAFTGGNPSLWVVTVRIGTRTNAPRIRVPWDRDRQCHRIRPGRGPGCRAGPAGWRR